MASKRESRGLDDMKDLKAPKAPIGPSAKLRPQDTPCLEEPPTHFWCFPLLPIELRLIIWKFALPPLGCKDPVSKMKVEAETTGRGDSFDVILKLLPENKHFPSESRVLLGPPWIRNASPLLLACVESRLAFREEYKGALHYKETGRVYFRPAEAIILITNLSTFLLSSKIVNAVRSHSAFPKSLKNIHALGSTGECLINIYGFYDTHYHFPSEPLQLFPNLNMLVADCSCLPSLEEYYPNYDFGDGLFNGTSGAAMRKLAEKFVHDLTRNKGLMPPGYNTSPSILITSDFHEDMCGYCLCRTARYDLLYGI